MLNMFFSTQKFGFILMTLFTLWRTCTHAQWRYQKVHFHLEDMQQMY